MALSDKSQEKLRRWLEDDHSWYWRLWMKAGAFWYNKVPRQFRFWGLIHLLARAALIAAAPITAVYYGSITPIQAGVVGAGLIILNVFTSVADRMSKAGASSPSFTAEGFLRIGDLLTTYKVNSIRAAERDAAIEACLGIIENIAIPETKTQKGDVSVNLITYMGSSTSQMRVRHRNPGNTRPKNRQFATEAVLGHYVCQRGSAPLTINNIKHFGRDFAASPTQNSYTYRSILLIPLLCNTPQGQVARGFVSIDCTRSYAFYGNRANSIAVTSKPVLALLREMIGGGNHARVEDSRNQEAE